MAEWVGGEGGGVDGQCMSCKTPNNNVYFRCIKVGHDNGDNYLHQLDFMSFFFGVEMLSSVKFCEKKLVFFNLNNLLLLS